MFDHAPEAESIVPFVPFTLPPVLAVQAPVSSVAPFLPTVAAQIAAPSMEGSAPVVPAAIVVVAPLLKIIAFEARTVQRLLTWQIKIEERGNACMLDEVMESSKLAATREKRRSLFVWLKKDLHVLDDLRHVLPVWAKDLGKFMQCSISGRRCTACVLAVDAEGSVYVLWSDGECRGYMMSEWEQNRQFRINSVTLAELQETSWDFKDAEKTLKLLDDLQPGAWQLRHALNLNNQMFGGVKFNPFLVVTDRLEVASLLQHLRADVLRKKRGVDPFAGLRTIASVFVETQKVKLWTNDLNKVFPAHFHLDALNPSSYTRDKLGQFDFAVTSVPFVFADIAIPLLALSFEAVFLHCPSWYLFQGSRARHAWIKQLAVERRIIVLHVNEERNAEVGKYAVWVAIFRSRDLANTYLVDANRLFEMSLPCFMG